MVKSKVIGSLWESYRKNVIAKDAGPTQLKEMRFAFYAGASSLFSTIINLLEPGTEPTENDLNRMSAIQDEIQEFVERETA